MDSSLFKYELNHFTIEKFQLNASTTANQLDSNPSFPDVWVQYEDIFDGKYMKFRASIYTRQQKIFPVFLGIVYHYFVYYLSILIKLAGVEYNLFVLSNCSTSLNLICPRR